MKDLLFFAPKYSFLIYISILYNIAIFLQKYLDQDFSITTVLTTSFTTILWQFTKSYYKNMSPHIFFYLYIMHTWVFDINKTLSRSLSITVLDKAKAFI